MFKYYPSLFPADLVALTKPISKAKSTLDKHQKIKRKAQQVLLRIKTSQTIPSHTVDKRAGIEFIYFNYADRKKIEPTATQVEEMSD